jgi:hypothetical protein
LHELESARSARESERRWAHDTDIELMSEDSAFRKAMAIAHDDDDDTTITTQSYDSYDYDYDYDYDSTIINTSSSSW